MISGERGALLINDPVIIERAELIWQKGTNRKAFFRGEVDKYTWVDIGSSFLPNELTAAFLYAQLEHAKRINAHRRALYGKYAQLLQPLAAAGLLELPRTHARLSNGHIFYVLCRSQDERARLIEHLWSRQIRAVFHYVSLHDSPAGLHYGRAHEELPVTENITGRLLRLPMFSDLGFDQVRRITHAVAEFHGQTLPA